MIDPTLSRHPVAFLTAAFAGALLLTPAARVARAGGPPPPPPEAYDACASRSAGDACAVAMPDRTVKGTCSPDRESGRLFCRPDSPPPPPPQAYEACSGKKDADACTVAMGDHTIDASCRSAPDGRMVCVPSRPPESSP